MRYMLLIYTDETSDPTDGTSDASMMMEGYGRFAQEATEAGVMKGGERLQPINAATTVRVREGRTMVTDGPFAETKEQLGGFFFLDCKDLDEALAYAAKIPGAQIGSIEVRPVWEGD